MKKHLSFLWISLLSMGISLAQCPMCKAVAMSAQKESGSNYTLNQGILYLFAIPYLALFTIGFIWYKRSKKYKQNNPS
jgi:hypothetical protein